MAIDFAQRIANNNRGSNQNNSNTQPKAQLWLNVGYYAGEGEHRRFVSLPVGIPLDTQEPIRISGQNREFNDFSAARNELLAMLIEEASKLEPGADDVVSLQIQVRKVNGAAEVSVGEDNAYSLAKLAGGDKVVLLSSKAEAAA
jgi:hypothetical protein